MKKFELIPNNGRKSFYGKCYVEEENGKATLYSYNTKICVYDINAGTIEKTQKWNFSNTTKQHQTAFCKFYGIIEK